MRRYELADEQWELIADLFPPEQGNGRPWRGHRSMVNAMLWILNAGSPWRDLPERYGPWQTAYNRFNRWRKDGTFDAILERLQMRLDEEGRIDWDLWMVDGSSVRAHASAAGGGEKGGRDEPRDHALGRSRGGFGTKIHLVADSEGTPLAVHVTPGQTHEVAGFESVVDAVRIPQAWGRPRTRPLRLAGDKGYDVPWVRDWLRRRHITADHSRETQTARPQARPPAGARHRHLSPPQRHRTLDQLAQARPTNRHSLREARRQLPGHAQAGHDPTLPAKLLTRHNLAAR